MAVAGEVSRGRRGEDVVDALHGVPVTGRKRPESEVTGLRRAGCRPPRAGACQDGAAGTAPGFLPPARPSATATGRRHYPKGMRR